MELNEVIKTQDQLDVYFGKASENLPLRMNQGDELDIVRDENNKALKGIFIPSDDLECTLRRKQRTRRVHVLAFEIWEDGSKTIQQVGVISTNQDNRVYRPTVHRSSVDEIILEEETHEGQ